MSTLSWRRLLGIGLPLSILLQGSFCQNNTVEPARGNLDRLGDVALVRVPGELRDQTLVVLAAPEIEQLRIFDSTSRSFLKAPNVFFPLSVRTGPSTRRLAQAAPDDGRLYALDSAADRVMVVRTIEEGSKPAFTRVGPGITTERAPGDIAVVARDDGPHVFVTIPDLGGVQVFRVDPATGESTELAFIDLGEGSHPAEIAADPTGDALVVTDAALDSVAIVRTDTLGLDRRIDVGGPTVGVGTGRLDPGDGVGPVALVLRRDADVAVALRLYRPDRREDRYVKLASVELPERAAVAYIPDQGREIITTGPTKCCPFPLDVATEATYAWASVVSSTGRLYYLRFDGARAGEHEGERGLLRLIDNDTEGPGFAGSENATGQVFFNVNDAPNVWFPPEGGEDRRPVIAFTPVDNYGEPPVMPYYAPGYALDLVYEGTPPGGFGRRGTFSTGVVTVAGDGTALTDRDFRVGDVLLIDVEDRPSSRCPAEGRIETTIAVVDDAHLTPATLSDDEYACLLTGGDFRLDVVATEAFVVRDTEDAYLGRVALDLRDADNTPAPPGVELSLPGLVLTFKRSDDGPPLRGSQLIIELDQHIELIGLDFSRQPTSRTAASSGFGTSAMLPTSAVGGEVFVERSDGVVVSVRRVYIGTGGVRGMLLEFNETETVLDFVLGTADTSYTTY